MRLLLDTHVWLWCAMETRKLGDAARAAILAADSDVYVSAASIWEVAIKSELGKLALPVDLPEFIGVFTLSQSHPGVHLAAP